MAAAGGEEAAAVAQALSRPLRSLQDPGCGRAERLRALEAVGAALRERPLSGPALQEVFGTQLVRPLSRCLAGDVTERCRELALQLLCHGLSHGDRPAEALPVLLPVLAQRLCPPQGAEPSEELRLGFVQLLGLLLQRCGAALRPYLDEVVRILQTTLLDHYAEVRRESCRCTVACAQALPEHFHMQSESLIKPLMQTISHQHYRVRVDVIQATGAVIQFGNGKSVDDVLSHLAQRLFDEIPKVRHAVTSVVGEWLLHLRDRYSHFHKLIPLLLGSFSDEIPENTKLAWTYWEKIGSQWEKENEEDLKDKMNFSVAPSYYPKGEQIQESILRRLSRFLSEHLQEISIPEIKNALTDSVDFDTSQCFFLKPACKHLSRPGLGCRELVSRNLSKILPGLCNDLTDWVESTRVKASQLLYTLLLHTEDHITQHMELLLRTLYQACLDEEKEVVKNCVKAAELIGTFVSPKVSLKLIATAFGNTPKPSNIMVLTGVIRGSTKEILQPHLTDLGDMVSQAEVCQRSEEVFYVEQLLYCVQALIEVCQEDCKGVSLQLVKILVTVMAIPSAEHLKEKVEEAMSSLAKVQGLDNFLCLYKQHIIQLMEWVSVSCDCWTCYSPEILQFDVISTHSGPVIGEALDNFILVLKTCLQPNKDPQMRLKLFTVLSQLLQKAHETINSQGLFPSYLETVIKDILAPNLQWHAGRTAAAIRATAVSCLWALIHCEMLSPEEILKVKDGLMPEIIAAIDEDSKITRMMACRIVGVLLKVCGRQFDEDNFTKTYTEVLKRLDDASCDVRLAAAHTLSNWFKCVRDSDVKSAMESHIEFLYQELLIYLDDQDQNTQDAVLEVLKEGSVLYPEVLIREVEGVVHKHRTPVYCNQLLHHIQAARDSVL